MVLMCHLRRLCQSITIRTLFLTTFLLLLIIGVSAAAIQFGNQWSRDVEQGEAASSVQPAVPTAQPSPAVEQKIQTKVLGFQLRKSLDEAAQKQAHLSFLGAKAASDAATVRQVDVYTLEYKVQQTGSDWIAQSALVYVPRSLDGASPVYVFAAGTSGLSDACAPSREQVQRANIGNYENHMVTQASQGYIAVLPDYEGFHDGQKFQPYFVADSEARSLLGAVQALEQLADSPVLAAMDSDSLFLTGYSQGGHAALAAANRWQMIDTEFELQGVIGYGPAFDVFDIFRDIPQLAPYLVLAYGQEYPDMVRPNDLLQPRWVQNLAQEAESFCIDRALKFYPPHTAEVYTPTFTQAVSTENLAANFSELAEVLRWNSVFENVAQVPILILQGRKDPLVTVLAQAENRETLCAAGAVVRYKEFPYTNHFQTRSHSFFEGLDWMEKRAAGEVELGNCGAR